jgi:hypothetical protein
MSRVIEKNVYYKCIGEKCKEYKVGFDEDGSYGSVYCGSYFAGGCNTPSLCKLIKKVKLK